MLVTALLKNEKIETTTAKAKEMRPLAEKMITLGKRGDLHARRQAISFIHDEDVVSTLFSQIAPRQRGVFFKLVTQRQQYFVELAG
jgi:large subunit ribosomal protein L17